MYANVIGVVAVLIMVVMYMPQIYTTYQAKVNSMCNVLLVFNPSFCSIKALLVLLHYAFKRLVLFWLFTLTPFKATFLGLLGTQNLLLA